MHIRFWKPGQEVNVACHRKTKCLNKTHQPAYINQPGWTLRQCTNRFLAIIRPKGDLSQGQKTSGGLSYEAHPLVPNILQPSCKTGNDWPASHSESVEVPVSRTVPFRFSPPSVARWFVSTSFKFTSPLHTKAFFFPFQTLSTLFCSPRLLHCCPLGLRSCDMLTGPWLARCYLPLAVFDMTSQLCSTDSESPAHRVWKSPYWQCPGQRQGWWGDSIAPKQMISLFFIELRLMWVSWMTGMEWFDYNCKSVF